MYGFLFNNMIENLKQDIDILLNEDINLILIDNIKIGNESLKDYDHRKR